MTCRSGRISGWFNRAAESRGEGVLFDLHGYLVVFLSFSCQLMDVCLQWRTAHHLNAVHHTRSVTASCLAATGVDAG